MKEVGEKHVGRKNAITVRIALAEDGPLFRRTGCHMDPCLYWAATTRDGHPFAYSTSWSRSPGFPPPKVRGRSRVESRTAMYSSSPGIYILP